MIKLYAPLEYGMAETIYLRKDAVQGFAERYGEGQPARYFVLSSGRWINITKESYEDLKSIMGESIR